MFCKLCHKSLYQELSFQTLFQIHTLHPHCEKYLAVTPKEVVIPIDQNKLVFWYLYESQNTTFDSDFIFYKTAGILLKNIQKYTDWSIIFWFEKEHFITLSTETIRLLFHMGKRPLLFLSIYAENELS